MDQVRFAAKWMQIIPSMIYCTCNFCSFLTTKFSKGGGDSHLKRRRYWSWILKRTSERHWGFLLALLEICFNPKEVQYPKRYRKSSLCGPFDAKHPMRYQNLSETKTTVNSLEGYPVLWGYPFKQSLTVEFCLFLLLLLFPAFETYDTLDKTLKSTTSSPVIFAW